MSLTYGFYNSVSGDRLYNAEQLSSLFDGLIEDGVYETIGDAFKVTADGTQAVKVGTGRAWFKHTWTYNDSKYVIDMPDAESLLDRIDIVALQINSAANVRQNSFVVVKGTPSTSPSNPTLTNTDTIKQVPLASIRRAAGNNNISQSNVTNRVGSTQCPFVIGVVKSMSVDFLTDQWSAEYATWKAANSTSQAQWEAARNSEYNTWKDSNEADFTAFMQAKATEWNNWFAAQSEARVEALDAWLANHKATFMTWFNSLQVTLDGDVAANLAARIQELDDKFTPISSGYLEAIKLTDDNGTQLTDSYGTDMYGELVYELVE